MNTHDYYHDYNKSEICCIETIAKIEECVCTVMVSRHSRQPKECRKNNGTEIIIIIILVIVHETRPQFSQNESVDKLT